MHSVLEKSVEEEVLWESQCVALSHMQTSFDHTRYDVSKFQGMSARTLLYYLEIMERLCKTRNQNELQYWILVG